MDYKDFLYQEFPKYLDNINNDLKPKWGLMSSQHLLEHLSLLFALSNGKLNGPNYGTAEKQAQKLTGFFKMKMPFIKNYDPRKVNELAELKFENMEIAKEKLVSSFERFKSHFEVNPDGICNHPVFGMLNHEQWIEFHARHIKYHLTQFGLIEDVGAYERKK